jgi:hypothetical protein
VNGVESVVPAPPDDPGAITVSATAVSGDGTTLLVQDGTVDTARVETFVYHIASGSFTSLGFLGNPTYANLTAMSATLGGNVTDSGGGRRLPPLAWCMHRPASPATRNSETG